MELRLSIIIPFYNVERYIAECLDSVFDQDIPLTEYEVICVNDGSPDRSRDIVLDYMGRYPNLRLIEHDHNKKLGAARNTGRSIAKGKYIWNIDSDDKIVSNCLLEMLNLCENNNLDILEFGAIHFSTQNKGVLPHVPANSYVQSGLDYLKELNSYQISRMCPIWRKMIRRRFLEDNHIFSPEINMGEDIPFSFKALMAANRLLVSPNNFYLYRDNDESLTGKKWIPSAESLYEKCITNSEMILQVAREVPQGYKSVKNAFYNSAKYTFSKFPQYFGMMSGDNRTRFKSLCRKSFFLNGFVYSLAGKKQYIKYILWIAGVRVMP